MRSVVSLRDKSITSGAMHNCEHSEENTFTFGVSRLPRRCSTTTPSRCEAIRISEPIG
jgi:hypothetical protein